MSDRGETVAADAESRETVPTDGSADADDPAAAGEDGTRSATDRSRSELLAEIAALTEENRRLRDSYDRARRTSYRRTAAGLAALGTLAAAGGLALPDSRTVLFALAATGLFGGLLTWYVTPERFVAADVGRDVHAAAAETGAALVAELGLTDLRVYVPRSSGDRAVLYVPQREAYTLPDDDELDTVVVAPDDPEGRGLAVRPSGGRLYDSFRATLAGEPAADPATAADQLADGLVEGLELARSAVPELDPDGGRLTVAVSGSSVGPLDRFDHPIVSFLATGLAEALDAPVTASVRESGDDRADYRVTLRWEDGRDRAGEDDSEEMAGDDGAEDAGVDENGNSGVDESEDGPRTENRAGAADERRD